MIIIIINLYMGLFDNIQCMYNMMKNDEHILVKLIKITVHVCSDDIR
jgi:hypothetical protein